MFVSLGLNPPGVAPVAKKSKVFGRSLAVAQFAEPRRWQRITGPKKTLRRCDASFLLWIYLFARSILHGYQIILTSLLVLMGISTNVPACRICLFLQGI